MSYVLKTSPRKKRIIPIPIKIVFFIVIILAPIYFFAPHSLSSFFMKIATPIWSITTIDKEEYEIENSELRKKLIELETRSQAIQFIINENKELKEALGRPAAEHMILGTVLKKPPFAGYDLYIIDIGKENGVVVSDRVYSLGNIPIGEVEEVYDTTSKVRLFSSSGKKYNVFIGEQNIEAVATGRGGGIFEATIPRETKVAKGNDVFIPSLGNSFVGKVQDIISLPTHPFATILFHHPINIFELRWVLVDIASSTHESL